MKKFGIDCNLRVVKLLKRRPFNPLILICFHFWWSSAWCLYSFRLLLLGYSSTDHIETFGKLTWLLLLPKNTLRYLSCWCILLMRINCGIWVFLDFFDILIDHILYWIEYCWEKVEWSYVTAPCSWYYETMNKFYLPLDKLLLSCLSK